MKRTIAFILLGVMLTGMLPSKILKRSFASKEFLDEEDGMVAYLDWIQVLSKAFSDKATFLSFDNPHHKAELVEQIGLVFGINPNYNPYAFGSALFRMGNGLIEFESGVVYDGDFLNNLFHGEGTMKYASGAVYNLARQLVICITICFIWPIKNRKLAHQ